MRPRKSMVVLAFGLILLTYVSSTVATANKTQLYFSYITTISSDQILASGGIPAVDMALEEINSNASILGNYTLNYTTILDSQCLETGGLDAFFHDFKNVSQPTYVSLMCCGCSTSTIPVAEISHHWNIAHMAYAAAASVLNDRQKYRSFFRALPSFDNLPSSVVAIMDYFGWTQMVAITQEESLFTSVAGTLESNFISRGWNLQNIPISTGADPFPSEDAFTWDADYRIVYINSYPPVAFSFLCEAYLRDMISPKYVYIIQGWYPNGWWNMNTENCSPEDLLAALQRSLAVIPDGYFANEDTSARAISNRTSTEFTDEYEMLINSAEYDDYQPLSVAGVAYDATWAMALGLDIVMERVRSGNDQGCGHLPGDLVPLEEFDYSNEKMGCVMEDSFGEARFTGITGEIAFNEHGSRNDNVILLQQYRPKAGTLQLPVSFVADITIHDMGYSFQYRESENDSTVWGESVPYDGATVTNIVGSNWAIVGVFYTLASTGAIFTIVCLIFNMVFRNRKVVKLSSPNLNYFLVVGAGMLYACIYFYTYLFSEHSQTVSCNVRLWLFSLGYTLCFAVILAKTWRVYYIFSNPTTKKKAIKDWILLVIIGIVVGVDTIVLLIGTAIPNARLNATLVEDEDNPTTVNDEGHNIDNFVYVCSSAAAVVWIAILFSYKGLLQILAMFMAFHTRKVRIKALNDSKEITVIVYFNSLTFTLLVVAEFALNKRYLLHSSLFALALFIGASIFLGLLFGPKAVSLLRDPEGTYVLSEGTSDGVHPQQGSTIQRKCSNVEFGMAFSKESKPDTIVTHERKNSYQVNSPEVISFTVKSDLGSHHEDSRGSMDESAKL